jgi:hypothetical protein
MPEDSVQLLNALDGAVRAHLAPQMLERGGIHTSGLSACDGYPGLCSLHSRDFSAVSGSFFWWIHRFTFPDSVLDVGFGDREFMVETSLFYPSIITRFAPWELLAAHQVPDSQAMSGNAWVLSADFMDRTIASISDGCTRHLPLLLRPDPKLIDRAQEMRGRRLIYAQQEQRKRDRERAVIQASRAFHESRPDEAVTL